MACFPVYGVPACRVGYRGHTDVCIHLADILLTALQLFMQLKTRRKSARFRVGDLRGTGEEAGAWETSTPYESLLVTISQAVRGGKLPAGWYQVPVTKETLQAPAGLSSVADAVWTGNHLKMVRFAVENKTLSALNIRESDFWQPGTRAVMFSQPASQLLAGARMDVYVIRDGEGN